MAESSSAMSGKWSRSRQFASTQSLREVLQFDRYLVTACSLMLMVVLVVGAAGYAGIQGLWSPTMTTANAAHPEQSSQYRMPRNTSSFITCK
jgi:hypothetical protein